MIGTRLVHYEVIRHLGSGAMGEVYEAIDLKLDFATVVRGTVRRKAEWQKG